MAESKVVEGEELGDRYRVIKVLGEGALGRTMLAHDDRKSRKVAVKELLPSRMKRWKDLDLFHRECTTLRSLSHEGIPRYYEDFVIEPEGEDAPPRLFLVQEFIEGESLQDKLDQGETFKEDEVRAILRQVLEILEYLHGLNPQVIHRDIKPANLMITPDGRIVMIDFGAVREAITFDGVGSTIVGTFGYMPPEQYAGKSEPATDLFALGATCVQLLTGRPPGELFEGIHEFKLPEDLPVTLGFEKVLLHMTEPEISKRYQSVDEIRVDLEDAFLMVPKESLTGHLPIPYDIRPAPRPFPSFYLRDAYQGSSHLFNLMGAIFGVLLTAVFPITGILMNQPVFAFVGTFAVFVAIVMAHAVSKKARNEISVYQRGNYTLGEVTGVFWSSANDRMTNLTYRYKVGDGFSHGAVATVDKAYKKLAPGDPIGVIYLPNEPTEHVMYAVPHAWSDKQTVGLDRRIREDSK